MKILVILLMVMGCASSCSVLGGSDVCAPHGQSVARAWNEAALDAVRRDFPAPTVHARNLFHLSVAMWDTWAAFDPDLNGYQVNPTAGQGVDRETAIAFAAHTVLSDRYRLAVGGEESVAAFDELLTSMCLDPNEPEPLGVEVANAVLDLARGDGSLESDRYVGPFEVANPTLVLREPGTTMADPNRWQQLEFVLAQTQNGQFLESNVQDYVGPHWGAVTPFALDPQGAPLPIDPGPPPLYGTSSTGAFERAAADVVRASSQLDPSDDEMLDISPARRGNNPLGENSGTGYAVNPMTGEPYPSNVVAAGDYYRVIAEFWADGPDSETPPGHWNTLANEVGDRLDELRLAGQGNEVSRLEWDVSLYLALNGALHDAAIAAWGAKAAYDYSRPISMIRYLAQEGDLPLEEGLVEVITAESSAAGERHEELAEFVGEVAIRSWARPPVFFPESVRPVRWIRAVEWMPYQRNTFVTPAFPGYVSGHSTFSRAAAEVLTSITGSEYFPGGVGSHLAAAGSLEFDAGPTTDIELQWATYFDAADEAGLSRIYGGIHVEVDDLAGRAMGSTVGRQAWEKAATIILPG